MDYILIDSGDGEKLERFGPVVLRRPAPCAVWKKKESKAVWDRADGYFSREEKKGWIRKVDCDWEITIGGLRVRLSLTDFGHLGIFPEHSVSWKWMKNALQGKKRKRVLNLFAYSGAATLAAAKEGAEVVHLDASPGMTSWARDNARRNGLENAPIRWIVDDALKFLRREKKREKLYDIVLLDPPTFGRGAKGEVFKIEDTILELLDLIQSVLAEDAIGIFFSCHTPGFTPSVLEGLLKDVTDEKNTRYEKGELYLNGDEKTRPLPSGAFAACLFG